MLYNYLKIALRNIQRHISYTVINVFGLGVSVACVVLIFSLVKNHLSFDNFHADANRIYRIVTEQHRDQISYAEAVPAPLGRAVREDFTFSENVARIVTSSAMISVEGRNVKLREDNVSFAEVELFEIFNFPLQTGSITTALKDPNTAVLTEKMAKRYFGDVNAIDKTFKLNGKILFRVTGILKEIPQNTDLKSEIYLSYPTLKQHNESLASDDAWGFIDGSMRAFIKLNHGVSVAQVETAMQPYVKQHRPNSKNVHHYKLQPLSEVHFDARYGGAMEKRNLWVMSLVGVLLMVTACVNFINLATAQATGRSKEVGVRKVLGGMRSQLFWQFITETGVITAVAVVLGLGIAYTMLPAVNQLFESDIKFDLLSDGPLLIFIPSLIVIVTLLAGVYPGLILSGFQPIQSLKGRLSDMKIGGLNIRRSLIVSQLVIAQLLIIGLIVVVYQMRFAREADMGFDRNAILMVPVGSSDHKMTSLRDELAKLPGIEKLSLCFTAPASADGWNTSLKINNASEDEAFLVSCRMADDQYLNTFGLMLAAGRNITRSDTVREFLVNETFAKKLGKTPEELLGTNIGVNGNRLRGPVVGVIKDFHDRSFHEDIGPIFLSTDNNFYNAYAIKLRTIDFNNTLKAIESKWSAMYPEQIYDYQFLDEDIADFYKTEDTMMKIIQAFALVAILIGCMGLYGLVSFMANQKNKEIGIRKVLGSSVSQVLWIFGKEFTMMIVIAFALAAPVGGYLMGKWLQEFQYKITMGPMIYVATILITSIICLVTVFAQAFSAARKNPVVALRTE